MRPNNGLNWGLLAGIAFSLGVWGLVIAALIRGCGSVQ